MDRRPSPHWRRCNVRLLLSDESGVDVNRYMTRTLFAVLVLSLAFCGRDGLRAQSPSATVTNSAPGAAPVSEVDQLKAQLAEKDKIISQQQELLKVYVNRAYTCDQQLTLLQVQARQDAEKK